MKANFHKLKRPIEESFTIRKDIRYYFEDKWHFHEMLELVLIISGEGKRYIGDSIESFSAGDVVLVGKCLPHVWRSTPPEEELDEANSCQSIVIHFPENFMGDHFLEIQESGKLKTLFQKAQMGIFFGESTRKKLSEMLPLLIEKKGLDRIILLLEILNIASKATDYSLLSSPAFNETIYNGDSRVNHVFEFVMDHFSNQITLEEVAEVANMNKTAFCRYFKKVTKKTFTTFLNEIRIGYACKLIQTNHSNITEAAYLSGYNSLSHFNKQFRMIKRVSPSAFMQSQKDFVSGPEIG
jgi:AraC-like DNA-binding protein